MSSPPTAWLANGRQAAGWPSTSPAAGGSGDRRAPEWLGARRVAGWPSDRQAPGWPSGRRGVGWHAYWPQPGAELPTWPVEVALAVECPAAPTPADTAGAHAAEADAAGGWAQALLLLRSPSRVPSPLRALAAAAREVEAVAGIDVAVELPLAVAPALPGLVPASPAAVLAHLAVASARGLAPPARRRHPSVGDAGTWRSSAGSVLTCDGPGGRSAQAVIALRGLGDGHAIAPPPGGALVLRAWRTRRGWGLACGLVLGSAEAMGLGREAGRRAADARAAGWLAAVATGQAALALARGGDPRQPPPLATAGLASGEEVAALVAVLLSPAAIGTSPTGPLRP